MESACLNVTDAAKLLGVSRAKMLSLIREGQVPSVRMGSRTIRVPRLELARWLIAATANPVPLPEPPVVTPLDEAQPEVPAARAENQAEAARRRARARWDGVPDGLGVIQSPVGMTITPGGTLKF